MARLTVTPNPTCTDVLTKLDASASSAPAGIVSYRFHYSQPINQTGFGPSSEDVLAYEGSSNATYYAFTWNRAPYGRGPLDGLADNGYVEGLRDPADVTVTVTDARGATATATVRVTFVQGDSADDRTGCPRDFSPPYSFPFAPGKDRFPNLTIASAGVSTSLPCRSRIVCMGTISLVLANPNGTIARQAAHRRKPQLIAGAIFRIAPGQHKRIQARWTKTGQRLLRGRRSVQVRVVIGAVAPKGNIVRRSKTISLTLPRHR